MCVAHRFEKKENSECESEQHLKMETDLGYFAVAQDSESETGSKLGLKLGKKQQRIGIKI